MSDIVKGTIRKISAEHKKRRRAICALLVVLLCKQVAKFLHIKCKNKGLKNITFTSTGKGV